MTIAASALVVSGCGFGGVDSIPAPGAIDGDDTYPVTIVVADAANLARRQSCRVNDVVVGSVASIELDDDLRAVITCRVRDSIRLPANAEGRLVQTSLLGERFVSLDPPEGVAPSGTLPSGARLEVGQTRTEPDTEVVLGALSQVLNGGSLASVQRIVSELDTALSDADLGGTLDAVRDATSTLDRRSDSLVRALTSVDRLAARLSRQRDVIATTLDSVPQGLAVLARQRGDLVASLQKLADLSRTVVPFLDASRVDLAADLRDLAPVLERLATVGRELPATLSRIATFPFPGTVLSVLKGDFAGAIANADIDLDALSGLLMPTELPRAPLPMPAFSSPQTDRGSAPADVPSLLDPLTSGVAGSLDALLSGLLGGKR
ncbi:MCE family protein [Nocardioides sp. LML1-1-1.1]|uniref:MCE family protein n=1 Tax=Nocardioides sp. LML1-1-1.1 TaxID=3135248 RepID=UPI003442F9D1